MKYCTNPDCARKGQLLPLSDFSFYSGHRTRYASRCKECCRLYKQRPGYKEWERQYQLAYSRTDKRRAQIKAYSQSEKGRAKRAITNRASQARNTEKVLARNAVSHAVEQKQLVPAFTLECGQNCGRPAFDYHHHLGYEPEHWLDVVPVCRTCHAKIHRKYPEPEPMPVSTMTNEEPEVTGNIYCERFEFEGYVYRNYSVDCADCGQETALHGINHRKRTARTAREMGWTRDGNRKWHCPNCSTTHKSP